MKRSGKDLKALVKLGLGSLLLYFHAGLLAGDTNAWTKGANGPWEEAGSWSMRELPGPSQTIEIMGAGEKIVTIGVSAAQNHPASLTVYDLILRETNTLMLDRAGTSAGLRVVNNLLITNGASLINLDSSLSIQGEWLRASRSRVHQIGGLIEAVNGSVYLDRQTVYQLEGGIFRANAVHIGSIEDCRFEHAGGRVEVQDLNVGYWFGGSSYHLRGGELIVRDALRVAGQYGGSVFIQDGGTNRVSALDVTSLYGRSSFVLNAGWLASSNVVVRALSSSQTFSHHGGTHFIANRLRLEGSARYLTRIPARYAIGDGALSARSIQLEGSEFAQTNAMTAVAEEFRLSGTYGLFFSTLLLDGGVLSCSNLTSGNLGGDILQTGGALIVTNLFSFGGERSGGFSPRSAHYTLTGGALVARDIHLQGQWSIGSSVTGRVINPGQFRMAGVMQLGEIHEQLGRLILASNSTIQFKEPRARLHFKESRDEAWLPGAVLTLENWSGTVRGGEQKVFFGENQTGLSRPQLRQIRFLNPGGFAAREYTAEILETGEIVPSLEPVLFVSMAGTNAVVSWSGEFTLQTSTNLSGPFANVPEATSPFTNAVTANRHQFFRLRSGR